MTRSLRASQICYGEFAGESVSGKVCAPNGLSEVFISMVGESQGCPLSPTLFSLSVDDVNNIERLGGSRACSVGLSISKLLYADDIVLISDSLNGL